MIEYADLLIDQESDHGKEMTINVIEKVGEEQGLIVLKKDEMELSIEDAVILHDHIGYGTNGIYRLESSIKALNKFLNFISSCIKAKLARYVRVI